MEFPQVGYGYDYWYQEGYGYPQFVPPPEWQIGSGFGFGRFLWKHFRPIATSTIKAALPILSETFSPFINNIVDPEESVNLSNFKEGMKKGAKKLGRAAGHSTLDYLKSKINQSGSGQKSRKSIKKKKLPKRINTNGKSTNSSVIKRKSKKTFKKTKSNSIF
jgi:hypothetical protein